MYIALHVKCLLFMPDFNETWTFLTGFQKYSNIKFYENPSGGSLVVPYGQVDRHDEASHFLQLCQCV